MDKKIRVLVRSTSHRLQTFLCSQLSSTPNIQADRWQQDIDSTDRLLKEFDNHQIGVFIVFNGNQAEDRLLSVEQVFIEVGMSIMKYGLERTIIIISEGSTLPSALSSVSQLKYKGGIDDVDSQMQGCATQVEERINNQQQQIIQYQVRNEIYWLSLIDCKPGQERLVGNRIQVIPSQFSSSITYLRSGVIYGEYDLSSLFKSSSINSAARFITDLRQKLHNTILSIDTKLVFPSDSNKDSFWINPNYIEENDTNLHDLVLFSCYPHEVEPAFDKIKKLATIDNTNPIYRYHIICVGIIFGKHDIFFLIESENVQSLDNFLYDILLNPNDGIPDYLTKNTTSLRIRKIIQE